MATYDISELPNVLRWRIAEVGDGAARNIAEMAQSVDEAIVEDTPVETGVARSNWIMALETPHLGEIPAYVPYPKDGGKRIGESANADAAIAQSKSVTARFTAKMKALVLSNSTPYIAKLNEATTVQTSLRFVENGIIKGLLKKKYVSIFKQK